MLRRIIVAVLLALAFACAAPAPVHARTRLDARVDALDARTLLTRDAASLVDPGRQRRARAIADLRHLASAGWGIAQILAYWWLWRSGAGARLRNAMRRRTRRRYAQRAVFGAVLGGLGPVAALPFAMMHYRIGYNAGMIEVPWAAWFAAYAARVALDAVIGAVVVAAILALVERFRIWYLAVAAGLYGLACLTVLAGPLLPGGAAQKTTPRTLSAAQAAIAATAAVPRVRVVVTAASRRGNALSARAAGIGPTASAVLADTDLVHFTVPELATVLARVDAHAMLGDPLRESLLAVTLLVLSAAVAVLLSDRVGFRRDDDVLSRLALVATFLGLVLVVTYPIYNAYERNLETRADRVALQLVPDRPAAIRAFVRTADVNLVPLCDRRSIRWYFDDRPPLAGRIAAAAGTADPCPGGGAATATPPP